VRTSPRLSEESKLAAKRKIEELEDDPLTLYKKMSKKEELDMLKDPTLLKEGERT
jgi:hypothetical protein